MPNVVQTFSGDSKQLEAAYQRIQRENVKLREEIHKVGSASNETSAQQAQGFAKLSALGAKAYAEQKSWSQGLATLDKQRQEEASAALMNLRGQSSAAWGQMGRDADGAREHVRGVTAENQKLTDALKAQSSWARGQAALDAQRQEEASAALVRLRGQSLAAWGQMGRDAASARTQVRAVTAENQKLTDALKAQSSWSRGLASLEKQRTDEAIAASRTLGARMRAVYTAARGGLRSYSTESAASDQTLAGYARNRLAEWASYASAVGIAVKAVRELISANKEVRAEEADVTFTLDTHFRGLQVQGRMNDAEAAGAREQVFDIAERQAAKPQLVAGIAKQLISSGFDKETVLKGGAAEELVKGVQASTMQGREVEDPKQFTESITQFLLAQTGKEKGEKLAAGEQASALSFDKLSQAVRQTQALFLSRNIQFSDLGELAKAAPALSRGGLNMTEQLAAYTKMRDVLDPEEAGTSMRNVVSRMQTAGVSGEKVKALAEVGLTPQDIDLVGESFDTALKRMRSALANLDPAQKSVLLKKIFEERGAQGADVLINNVEDLQKYRQEATDTTAFDESLKAATQGYSAGKTREETQKQRQRFGGQGVRDALIVEAIETEYGAQGHAVLGKLRAKEFSTLRGVGVGESTALTGVDPDVVDRVQSRVASAMAGKPVDVVGGVEIAHATSKAEREEATRRREALTAGGGATANAAATAQDEAEETQRRELYARRAQKHREEPELSDKRKKYLETHGPQNEEDLSWIKWRNKWQEAEQAPSGDGGSGTDWLSAEETNTLIKARNASDGRAAGRSETPLLWFGDEFNAQNRGEQLRMLNEAKMAKYDLEHAGHYDAQGTFAPDENERPWQSELKMAEALAPVIEHLERLIKATEKQTNQQAANHRESQTTTRSRNAQSAGAGFRGREVA